MRALGTAFAFACVASLVGCAHGAGGTQVSTPSERTPIPDGPTPSFAPPDANVTLRFALGRVRGLPYAAALSDLVGNAGTYRTFAAGLGGRPVDDLDVLHCAARAEQIGSAGIFASHWTFVIEHSHAPGTVRSRLEAMAERNRRALRFEERDGIEFAPLPMPSGGFAEHAVLLTAPNEVVVGPMDELDRLLPVAADHAARRAAGLSAREPGILDAFPDDEIARLALRTEPHHDARLRFEDGAVSERVRTFDVRLRLAPGGGGGIRLDATMVFASEDGAIDADARLGAALRDAAQRPAIRLLGFASVLDGITRTRDGASLRFDAELDAERTTVLLGLLALRVAD